MNRRNIFKMLAALPAGSAVAALPSARNLPSEPRGFASGRDVAMRLIDILHELHVADGAVVGLSTGIDSLDRITRGLRPGSLNVIAARPSMGKTTLAMNIATHALLNGSAPVGIFSMEKSAEQLMLQIIASLSRTSIGDLRTGRFDSSDWPAITAAMVQLADAPLYIDDTAGMSVAALSESARQLKQREPGLALLVIDYLQLVEEGGDDQHVTRSLKALAAELDLAVVVTSQLGRTIEERRDKCPRLSDLRKMSSVADVADCVLLIYRDEVYDYESPRQGLAEVIVARNRYGEVGSLPLQFEGRFATFSHWVPDFESPLGQPRQFSSPAG